MPGETIVYDEMWADMGETIGKIVWRISVPIEHVAQGSSLVDKRPVIAVFSNDDGIGGYARFEFVTILKGKVILEAKELYSAGSGHLFPEPALLVAASLPRARP